jgi:hypothetical protein
MLSTPFVDYVSETINLERVSGREFAEFLVAGEGCAEEEEGEKMSGFAFVARRKAAVAGQHTLDTLLGFRWQRPFRLP